MDLGSSVPVRLLAGWTGEADQDLLVMTLSVLILMIDMYVYGISLYMIPLDSQFENSIYAKSEIIRIHA